MRNSLNSLLFFKIKFLNYRRAFWQKVSAGSSCKKFFFSRTTKFVLLPKKSMKKSKVILFSFSFNSRGIC